MRQEVKAGTFSITPGRFGEERTFVQQPVKVATEWWGGLISARITWIRNQFVPRAETGWPPIHSLIVAKMGRFYLLESARE